MPEHEFEIYLSLLSRFLRLKSAQRGEIADELRDHLEERLEALAARGLSRAEAIRTALDEFGDAAELARHFTHVAHTRQRRMIMRVTFGTVAALAAAVLVAIAFWPESPQAPAPRMAVAQAPAPGGGPGPHEPGGAPVAMQDDDKSAIEAKLSERIGKIDFAEMPLSEVLEYLSDKTDIDILINRGALNGEGIDTNQAVELQVKRTNLTARMALDLVLEPLKLSYTIRDGLIVVTTIAEANQIQVYNVRDLLRNFANEGAAVMGAAPRMMLGGNGRSRKGGIRLAQGGPAGMPPGATGGTSPGMGGGLDEGVGTLVRQTDSLAEVIATTIDPASWDSDGGNGSIVQYHELLVVKNSQTVHGKIKALLEMMRTSAGNAPTAGGRPGGAGLLPGPAGVPGGAPGIPSAR